MIELIVIIVCIVLSIFSYKKTSNRCKKKGRGKIATSIISITTCIFVFVISGMIGVSNFSPDTYSNTSNNIAANTEKDNSSVYTMQFKSRISSDENIVINFDKNNEFEMSALKEMKNYEDGSALQERAMLIFHDYGIRLNDFDKLILPVCSKNVDDLKSKYRRETASWMPYSHYQDKDFLKSEQEYRDNYNKTYGENMTYMTNKMNECFYDLSQKLPDHSPRPKPKH